MIVESYAEGGKSPSAVSCTRLVVRDDHGNPIMLAVMYSDDQILCAHQGDDDFETLLNALGIEASVVLRRFSISPKD